MSDDGLAPLLLGTAAGDRNAFSDLYDATIDTVYGLARRVTRNDAIAAEVAHDVMLTVWRQAATFDPTKGRAMSWIATITRRRAIDVIRSNESSRRREGNQPAPAGQPDPVADAVQHSDERDRVRSALAALTEKEWSVIDLAYFGGLTYREVAEQLSIPVGTVKTRARSALRRLGTELGTDHG